MTAPKPKQVYDNPDAYWGFVTVTTDSSFEGQHFDRKEAGRPQADGTAHNAKLSGVRNQIEECVSAFANATGGLLVLGVSSTGVVAGLQHLNESQLNSMLKFERLVHHGCQVRLHDIVNAQGAPDRVALFLVPAGDGPICETVQTPAKAWIRQGPQNVPLSDATRDRLKRDRRVVDFERAACTRFDAREIDAGVLKEFKDSYLSAASYEWTDEELLYQVGAISREGEPEAWTNAGTLFFSANPQRVLPQARIRVLRFEAPITDRDERPPPTYDKSFDGSITKQIRDFRTFVADSAFFKTFQRRNPDGGFTDEPEYPVIAIDEAVVNAVAHRDYAIQVPILCEKYTDAFVVRSPGVLRQDHPIPQHFTLNELRLEHLPRNAKLIEWLKEIRDPRGAVYVRALREGTRQMRDQMSRLGLPSPEYLLGEAHTEVILHNDVARREAPTTGAVTPLATTEFSNLYPLQGPLGDMTRAEFDQKRRALVDALATKLRAAGWFIDRLQFGGLTAHRQGMPIHGPEAVARIVRIYPAFTFQVRQYFDRAYLVVDYTAQTQTVLTAAKAVARFGPERLIGLWGYARWRGGWERVQILSLDNAFCRVSLPDYDQEDMVPVDTVLPRLRRDMINEAVREVAPDYDLAREIKSASLALQPGAARTRAERTQAVVDDLAETVFPIMTGTDEIQIATVPMPLAQNGDGRRSLRVEALKEPEVEFHNHRSGPNIRDGITQFGSYDHQPRDVELVPVCAPEHREAMQALIERLRSGKFKYRGSERTFSIRLNYHSIVNAAQDQAEAECRRLLDQFRDWRGATGLPRLFLAHCPEEGYASDDETAPYYRIKRLLLEAGIPNQMVDTPTLRNPDYKDLNLALNIVAKTGTAPWVLPESIPDADFFVGLSYTDSQRGDPSRLMGFANVFNQYGRWEFFSGGTEVVAYADRTRYYETLVADTLKKLTLSEEPTVCFHYSARFSREDREAVLRGARRIRPKGKYVFVWINTHHQVRLYDTRAETDGSIARGRYMIGGRNQIYLSTTGFNPYRKTLGTPHVLEVNVHVEPAPGAPMTRPDLRALANQVLSLTKLNWASTDSLCAEPITTKYAGDIAYLTAAFLRQNAGVFSLHPVLERTPWFI
jgi:predicted HTH transcriptional regulator